MRQRGHPTKALVTESLSQTTRMEESSASGVDRAGEQLGPPAAEAQVGSSSLRALSLLFGVKVVERVIDPQGPSLLQTLAPGVSNRSTLVP